jgi:uncharacterized protein
VSAERGPWGPFATAALAVLIAGVFVVTQTVLAIPYLIVKVARSPGDVQAAARVLPTDGLFLALAEIVGGSVALRPVPRPTILRWLLYTALLGALLDGLSYAAGHPVLPEWMLATYRSAGFLPLLLFAFLVVAPVLEEAVFRGFLFEGLRHSRLGDVGAILLASSVWASVHLQYEWFYVGQIFAFGLLLGAARLRTRSLVPPILMHATFSAIATLEVALQSSGRAA